MRRHQSLDRCGQAARSGSYPVKRTGHHWIDRNPKEKEGSTTPGSAPRTVTEGTGVEVVDTNRNLKGSEQAEA